MSDALLTSFSDHLADAVAAAAPSVVQVQGRRRAVSGVVFAADAVVTTARAIGRDGTAHVRVHDGRTIEAHVTGWDSATGLAVLSVAGIGVEPARVATSAARVGHIALAIARSWSNAVTASVGLVSVIGGPLPTGHGQSIEHVIRTSAPMHDGFAGGAFVDVSGHVLGISTAASIRGLGVVIPHAIAWRTAATLVARGHTPRGYLGLAGQPVRLGGSQQTAADGQDRALLVVNVAPGSPAEGGGVLTGDLVIALDGTPIASPEDLLEHLWRHGVGRPLLLRVLRGDQALDRQVTPGPPPARA